MNAYFMNQSDIDFVIAVELMDKLDNNKITYDELKSMAAN